MTTRLRVLMICPQFRPLVGGYERAAERLSLGLISMGHVVHVATERRRREWPRLESERGLEIHRLWCIPRKGLHILSGLASLGGFLLCRGRSYDVFHVHQYGWTAAAAVCMGHLFARPVVLKLTNTGPDGIDASLPSGPLGRLSRFLHRQISACVVTSERARDEAIAFGIPSARIHLIPNPLDTGRFHPLGPDERERLRERLGVAGKFLAISVSRLSSEKNHRMLVGAWTRLPASAEGFALAILGDGPLRSEIEGVARQSPAATTIRLLGNVEDPLPWYQAADLFLLSSSHEGLSNSLMEALACGVPVVSTRVSGSEDILGRTQVGQLVDIGDEQAMALAIQRFREDPVWHGQCSHAARRHAVEHYSLPGVSQAIAALYRSLVDGDGRRPVTLVTYGTVQASAVGSTGSAWDLAKHLYEAGRLESVICTSFAENTDPIPTDRFVTPVRYIQRGIFRVIDRIESLLGRELRSLREWIFDQFVAHSSALHRAQIVVFRKPNFLATARALRRRGTPSYAIASIHHPRLNHDRVVAELARWGLHDHSLYTDLRRARRVARFFETCDHVLTMSAVGRKSFLAHGIASNRVIDADALIGADCTRFQPRASERTWQGLRVLHLSNMNAIKGLGILFEAWTRIDSREATLLLAGPMDGTTRRLFEMISPAHCVLLGPVSDTARCYRDADVFVCPSLSDSNPNAALEAMASGLPLIISDACGASVLIDPGVNGFVYRYDDPDALAQHLSWCSRNPQLLPEMARAARRTALANQRDRFSEAVLRAIDGSLSSRNEPGSIARAEG